MSVALFYLSVLMMARRRIACLQIRGDGNVDLNNDPKMQIYLKGTGLVLLIMLISAARIIN